MQMQLPMFHRLEGPAVLNPSVIEQITDFHTAVLVCWARRRDQSEGAQSACARYCGIQVSHMSSYLSEKDGRRDLPAKYIKAFEVWCGNSAISQFLAMGSRLTVLEEMQAVRLAA